MTHPQRCRGPGGTRARDCVAASTDHDHDSTTAARRRATEELVTHEDLAVISFLFIPALNGSESRPAIPPSIRAEGRRAAVMADGYLFVLIFLEKPSRRSEWLAPGRGSSRRLHNVSRLPLRWRRLCVRMGKDVRPPRLSHTHTHRHTHTQTMVDGYGLRYLAAELEDVDLILHARVLGLGVGNPSAGRVHELRVDGIPDVAQDGDLGLDFHGGRVGR